MKTFIGNPYNEYESDSDELGDLSRDTFMDNIIEDEWPITDGWFGNVAVANMTQDVNDEGWNSDAPSNAFILEPGVENDLYGELSDIEDDSETEEDYIFDPSTLYSFNYINVLMDDESENSDNPEEPENN